MASQSVFNAVKVLCDKATTNTIIDSNHDLAWKIAMALNASGLKLLQEQDSKILSELNNGVTNLVLSNSRIPLRRRLEFFNFLAGKSDTKPDLRAHITLSRAFLGAEKRLEAWNLMNRVTDLESPTKFIVESIFNNDEQEEKKVSRKLCGILFDAYVKKGKIGEALNLFDDENFRSGSPEIDERTCFQLLNSMKNLKMADSSHDLVTKMIQRGIRVSTYSLSVTIECLCRNGEAERAKNLLDDLISREIVTNPSAFPYNTLVRCYIERRDFHGVCDVLRLMERDGVGYDQVTFTLLIDWYGLQAKLQEALKLFDEMRQRRIKPDVYVYTSLIKWSCKNKDLKTSISLFDEMIELGIDPTAHTYGTLINGFCKSGQMGAAENLAEEMDRKKLGPNQIVYNTLIDGFCRKGMIEEAMNVRALMEEKGIKIDIFCYNSIANGLCNLNRYTEAKRLLNSMVENGTPHNLVTLTTLIGIHCKQDDIAGARRALKEVEQKAGLKPNAFTYNVIITAYCKKGTMIEARKVKDEMVSAGLEPDSYTYTALIHGECCVGNLDAATKLFGEMTVRGLKKTVVTYTAMISGLTKGDRKDEAYELYDEMVKSGIKPDDIVYTSLVRGTYAPKTLF